MNLSFGGALVTLLLCVVRLRLLCHPYSIRVNFKLVVYAQAYSEYAQVPHEQVKHTERTQNLDHCTRYLCTWRNRVGYFLAGQAEGEKSQSSPLWPPARVIMLCMMYLCVQPAPTENLPFGLSVYAPKSLGGPPAA